MKQEGLDSRSASQDQKTACLQFTEYGIDLNTISGFN